MRKTASTVLIVTLLALSPLPLLAGVYKCAHDGQTVYRDTPCGKVVQKAGPNVSVVPPFEVPKEPWSVRRFVDSLGLDSTGGVIAALLFGIPISFVLIFFLTRKSKS